MSEAMYTMLPENCVLASISQPKKWQTYQQPKAGGPGMEVHK